MKTSSLMLLGFILATGTGCKSVDRLLHGKEKRSAAVAPVELPNVVEDGPNVNTQFAAMVRKETGVTSPTLSDADIRRVAAWVVDVLEKSGTNRLAWHTQHHSYLPMYFDAYVSTDTRPMGAFCQKSALSVSETLIRLGVRSRQIHMYNPLEGVGDHQFLQYENPSTGKWGIIDPYFGVFYEKDGEIMGREDMYKFVLAGGLPSSVVKTYDLHRGGAGAGPDLDKYWQTREIRGGLGYLSLQQDETRRSPAHL